MTTPSPSVFIRKNGNRWHAVCIGCGIGWTYARWSLAVRVAQLHCGRKKTFNEIENENEF